MRKIEGETSFSILLRIVGGETEFAIFFCGDIKIVFQYPLADRGG
ncbi:MAG: hypothetical protein ANABAC_0668 [Anaerolineae bacterium]|nr:MAG: hypothetical protein ANABAC_0668 [Anaerolineae bacterium]